jgi:hypothetical protein
MNGLKGGIMKEKIICPVCGYVTISDRLGKVCPVCGANRSVFKPFQDEISSKRRCLLNLHLHQVVVHFPQALSVVIFFLFLFSLVVSHPLKRALQLSVWVMMGLLPFSVLAAMFSGMLDAKIRFKRLKGALLKAKMMVAGIFLVSSVTMALLVLLNAQPGVWIYLQLSGICLICSLFQGFMGGKLVCLVVKG